MFDRRENAWFGQSYARQKEELLRRAKRRVKKLLVIVTNGTLRKTGTGKRKVKNTLLEEILPSCCTQVTSRKFTINPPCIQRFPKK